MARKMKSMDGNNAAAHVSYAFSEVAAIYPNGIHGAIAVQIRVRVLLFVVLLRYLNGSIGGAGGNTQAQQIFQKSHNTTS